MLRWLYSVGCKILKWQQGGTVGSVDSLQLQCPRFDPELSLLPRKNMTVHGTTTLNRLDGLGFHPGCIPASHI